MRNRILIVALSALLLTGCPPQKGFSGRYVITNNTGATLANLSISAAGRGKNWEETLAGQGWIHSEPFGPKFLIVTWSDETGDHQEQVSFEKKVATGSRADLYIELKPNGEVAWRIIDPPRENGDPSSYVTVVAIYFFYSLAVALVVGVPLALAAIVAFGLFKGVWTGLTAMVQGLHGDRTVFQFSIREILLLTTVVALAIGWAIEFLASTKK